MQHNAYEILGEANPGRWLITCDHATNHVPDWVGGGDLGLPAADMERHIAFDPGAAGVTRALAEELRSPALLSNFSRLVIDPNRGEDDPTLLMRLYDGTVIPANRHAGAAEREQRLDRLYRPYHEAYAGLAGRRNDTVIAAIHSFTPKLRGRPPRPWQIAILYSHRDDRLARPMIDRLREEPDLSVGENQPYSGHLPGDSVDRHALAHGRPNILIELRNDVIATPDAQRHWARRIAPVMEAVLAASGL
ncbi:N-formylglutamate amidohydrolase [Ponticoccus sp. SC2-23]|uniref:N-formylglutamate amidohydrolase n=1 Tax=Alexandriicola marinus TaxID=2081710 RepID=UPI000FDB6061|nr:N-formylglutamate amidohydrolase [Alexandriicola marinus]MBM1222095.1 N-formylglutamate amidohydrolase [Ponticoccus sp. SC6-9]MBM1226782.1 N-formylglutamate amidohydrolase [Ponticoccus sp. SC6-15]MBM1231042.1 N-formylglutamate amidohydrolase [Ponticoccus sp. SC6-38]MBM1235706.1 N-formylglutamate amidohydrolase [Ponticoccus sp. SC6-45]MBM1240064.1 N-formylglutamate amidohydrolase [Ponticoccus sp. SC6-49]MBM1244418.1 N-formylglutamate amidohydrolase [Ponticoccus sp. SC2-64]MBM1249180.1 N-fo